MDYYAVKAKELLAPFRDPTVTRPIHISGMQADALERKLAEALTLAYKRGWMTGRRSPLKRKIG